MAAHWVETVDVRMPGNGKVFVSHSHEDNAVCAPLLTALRDWGVDYWFDLHRLDAGQDLSDRIQQAITERDIFIRVCTGAVQQRPFWLKLEANAFRMLQAQDENAGLHGKRVFISLVLDSAYSLQPFERTVLYIDATSKPPALWLEELRRALGVASAEAAPPSSGQSLPQWSPPPPGSSGLLPPPLAYLGLGYAERQYGDLSIILPPLCAVAGGPFWMGSEYQDGAAADSEKPRHAVDVPLFSIARYPVTVAEYACFVRHAEATSKGGALPRTELDMDWTAQCINPEHRVVCVTWQQASDYAAWIADLTQEQWRLPTEAEWEKAARWDGKNRRSYRYPWGDDFDPARANTSVSGVRATTPVGSYPTGASPCGAQDMVGNVWEWTSSAFLPYPYTPTAEQEASGGNRVLRGGSWHSRQERARPALRNVMSASYFDALTGFRLARTPTP